MEEGGREGRLSEKRGEETTDEEVDGREGAGGLGVLKEGELVFFFLFSHIDNLVSWLLGLSVHSDSY